jgi:hypothetical protein
MNIAHQPQDKPMINRTEIINAVGQDRDVQLSTGDSINVNNYSNRVTAYKHYVAYATESRRLIAEKRKTLSTLHPDVRQARILQANINNMHNALAEYRLALKYRWDA